MIRIYGNICKRRLTIRQQSPDKNICVFIPRIRAKAALILILKSCSLGHVDQTMKPISMCCRYYLFLILCYIVTEKCLSNTTTAGTARITRNLAIKLDCLGTRGVETNLELLVKLIGNISST
jgi:hypothetical protein